MYLYNASDVSEEKEKLLHLEKNDSSFQLKKTRAVVQVHINNRLSH
jgi:hypothetical protein